MSDVAAYRVLVCVLFPVQGNNAHTNTWYAATSLIILICDFSKELYVLPDDDDDMRCAIETCRCSESVLV